MADDQQGIAYAECMQAELREEHDRRRALDGRARDVHLLSGSALGLVAAGGTLILGKDFRLTPSAGGAFAFAFLFLLVSLVFALIGSNLAQYKVATVGTLKAMLSHDHWADDPVTARYTVATLQLGTIETLRAGNNLKATYVQSALQFQGMGLGLIAVSFGLAVAGI